MFIIKRIILSVLLLAALLLTVLCGFAGCDFLIDKLTGAAVETALENHVDSQGVFYEILEDYSGFVVKDYDKNIGKTNIVIPETCRGLPVVAIEARAFYKAEQLESVVIGNNVKELDWSIFEDCINLKKVTLGSGLTEISTNAFRNTAIESIVIPESVTKISFYAFADCPRLKKVTVPKSVTTICSRAFENCYALEEVVLNEGLTVIENNAFCHTGLKKITLPGTLTKLEDEAFSHCTALEEVQIKSKDYTLGTHVFSFCDSLKGIDYSGINNEYSGETNEPVYLGYWCTGLEYVVLGFNTRYLDDTCFEGCRSLNKVFYTSTPIAFSNIEINNKYGDLAEFIYADIYYYSETAPTDTAYNYWYYDENGFPAIWPQ
ncbi:MAG: leucine-rich repeat domain-containing protein [Oscillospiraceae bacterium]|nr:leucine-rich repeat domain-containing protein [Oscillospiraceae bacterium]